MKQRTPGTFASAVTRIKNALGEEACADEVGKSVSTVRKWADPDHPSLPNLEQALRLDLAFTRTGLGEAPVFSTYSGFLARRVADYTRERQDLLLAALSVQAAVGELSQAIRSATLPDSPAGVQISDAERRLILSILERLGGAVSFVEIALDDAEASDGNGAERGQADR